MHASVECVCIWTLVAGDIGNHLQSMFYLLRPQDTIKVAVKLESAYPGTYTLPHTALEHTGVTGKANAPDPIIFTTLVCG